MKDNENALPPEPDAIDLDNHPCFNRDACSSFGRIHLPVAPKCNIQCNYCNRDFDCVNESRPGVTSSVLSPGQALVYLDKIMEQRYDIAVVGIAGPGDPFANPEETMETFRLVREKYPKMILCLSTNGLGLTEDHVRELVDLKVSHVTITMNGINPEIAGQVYAWACHEKRVYRNVEAGKLMIEKQLQAIRWIKAYGMIAKVNSIIVPGVNADHIPAIAKKLSGMDVDIMNCIPLLPTQDTAFEHLPEPDAKMRFALRMKCGEHISQMTHCARCRADAVGRLGQQNTDEIQDLIKACSRLPLKPQDDRPYVAAATREGMLVNLHLGDARVFTVFGIDPDDETDFVAVDTRRAPEPGSGDMRWAVLADRLKDCKAILVNAAGPSPKRALEAAGIKVIEMDGMVETGLAHVFHREKLPASIKRRFTTCGAGISCGGDGTGCG